jgi:hypothetical protein
LLIVASTGFFSLILLVAIIEACFEFILAQRAAQRTAAWRLLVAAIASGRSTVEDLRFHQNRFSGFVARAYRKLLADLNGGMPWSAAIAANRRALPRMAQAVAGVIARDPAAAVRDFDEDDDRDAAFGALREHMAQRVAYLATISMMMVGVMTFVAIKVVPSYQAIFADFGLDLPKITISFIVAANAFSSYAGGPILAAIVLACAAAGIVGLFYLCDRPVLQNVGDRLARSRHDAQVLRLLAGAIVRGAPLDEALAQLSHGDSAYPSRYFRRRLIEAGTLMFTGAEWQAALHKARFVTTAEADALRSAQRVGNLPALGRGVPCGAYDDHSVLWVDHHVVRGGDVRAAGRSHQQSCAIDYGDVPRNFVAIDDAIGVARRRPPALAKTPGIHDHRDGRRGRRVGCPARPVEPVDRAAKTAGSLGRTSRGRACSGPKPARGAGAKAVGRNRRGLGRSAATFAATAAELAARTH